MAQKAIRDRFEVMFRAEGEPEAMLLVREMHDSGGSTLWLRVPGENYQSMFPELQRASEAELPRNAIFLGGKRHEYEKLFQESGHD